MGLEVEDNDFGLGTLQTVEIQDVGTNVVPISDPSDWIPIVLLCILPP